MTTRRFLLAFLLVSIVIAGVASYYASSHPDGLEYVAGQTGFEDAAKDSPVAGSPLADYSVAGVENERLSGGLAGVIGVASVLILSTGIFTALGRRRATNPKSTATES